MTSSLNDLRFAVTETEPASLVAVGLPPAVDAKAATYAREHNTPVNILRPRDGFDLVAKVSPSGMRVDVSPPPPK